MIKLLQQVDFFDAILTSFRIYHIVHLNGSEFNKSFFLIKFFLYLLNIYYILTINRTIRRFKKMLCHFFRFLSRFKTKTIVNCQNYLHNNCNNYNSSNMKFKRLHSYHFFLKKNFIMNRTSLTSNFLSATKRLSSLQRARKTSENCPLPIFFSISKTLKLP